MGRFVFIAALLIAGIAPTSAYAEGPKLSVLRTKYYRIHTDLDSALVNDLAARMDGMYDEYARRLSGFQPRGAEAASEVYLFRRQADYHEFTGKESKNTSGVYMPSRNALAAFLDKQGRDQLRRTLQHEAFHQFADKRISHNLPPWLNEGLAQLFEEGIWTGSGFWIGQVPPWRVRQLQTDIERRKLIPFTKLLPMSHETWSSSLANDHGVGAIQYNQAWAMVHFLVNATDVDGKAKYRSRLLKMLELLSGGAMDGQSAFEAAFSSNLDGFQARFVDYANALAPTREASLIEGQDVLADMITDLRSKGRVFASADDLREFLIRVGYVMQYESGGMKWSSERDVKRYFTDPAGRMYTSREFYFDTRAGDIHPDIVCRPSSRLQLRTRFYREGNGIAHEVVVEGSGER